MLELVEGKLSWLVLRGGDGGNAIFLPGVRTGNSPILPDRKPQELTESNPSTPNNGMPWQRSLKSQVRVSQLVEFGYPSQMVIKDRLEYSLCMIEPYKEYSKMPLNQNGRHDSSQTVMALDQVGDVRMRFNK